MSWRLAWTGGLDRGIVTTQSVPLRRRGHQSGDEERLARREFALPLILAAQIHKPRDAICS